MIKNSSFPSLMSILSKYRPNSEISATCFISDKLELMSLQVLIRLNKIGSKNDISCETEIRFFFGKNHMSVELNDTPRPKEIIRRGLDRVTQNSKNDKIKNFKLLRESIRIFRETILILSLAKFYLNLKFWQCASLTDGLLLFFRFQPQEYRNDKMGNQSVRKWEITVIHVFIHS